MDVGELQARLTADVSNFVTNMAKGSDESKALAAELTKVGIAGDRLREEFAAGVVEGITAEFKDMQKAAASVGEAMQRVGANLGGPAAGLKDVAGAANVADGEIRSLSRRALQGAQDLTQLALSGRLTATNLLLAARGTKDLAASLPAIIANNPSGVFASIARGAATLAPVLGPAAVAFVVFEKQLSLANEKLAREKAKLADFAKTSGDALKKLQEETDKLKFDASIAGLSEFDQETARSQRDVHKLAEEVRATGAIFAQGLEVQINTENLTARVDAAMKNISKESQDAGRALQTSIREASDSALADLAKLDKALDIKPAEETLTALRALGDSLNFKPSLAELAKFQAELDNNAAKIREIGEKAGFLPAAIDKMVKDSNAKLTHLFEEEHKIKIQVDPAAAEAEVTRFLASIDAKPAAQLKVGFDVGQAVRELDVLRAKILDTPEGEFKVKLEAEATALEGKIAESRAAAQTPAVMPIDADTSAAQAKIDELRKEAERFAGALDAVAGKSRLLGTFDLSGLNSAISSALGAIKSGDAGQIQGLIAGLKDFVAQNTSKTGIFTGASPEIIEANKTIAALSQALALLGKAASSTGADPLGTALDDLKKSQADKADQAAQQRQQQIQQQQQQLEATRETTSAITNLSEGLSSGNFAASAAARARSLRGVTTGTRA